MIVFKDPVSYAEAFGGRSTAASNLLRLVEVDLEIGVDPTILCHGVGVADIITSLVSLRMRGDAGSLSWGDDEVAVRWIAAKDEFVFYRSNSKQEISLDAISTLEDVYRSAVQLCAHMQTHGMGVEASILVLVLALGSRRESGD